MSSVAQQQAAGGPSSPQNGSGLAGSAPNLAREAPGLLAAITRAGSGPESPAGQAPALRLVPKPGAAANARDYARGSPEAGLLSNAGVIMGRILARMPEWPHSVARVGLVLADMMGAPKTAEDVARYVDQHRAPAPFVPGELCAWPAVSTLAAEAGCSGRWTRQAVEFMEEAGLLLVEVRNTNRGRTSSAYKLAAKALTVYQQASEARQARDAARAEAWKPRPALPPGAPPHRSPATAGRARKAAPPAGAQWNSSAAGPAPEALPVEPSGTPVPPTYPRLANGTNRTGLEHVGTENGRNEEGTEVEPSHETENGRKVEQLADARTANGLPPGSAAPPVAPGEAGPVARLREWAPGLCARWHAQAFGSGSPALRQALAAADLAEVERVARACERSALRIDAWAHRLGVMGVTSKGPRSGLVWLVEQSPALAAALQKASGPVYAPFESESDVLARIERDLARWDAEEQARREAMTPEEREAEDRAKAVEAAELEQLRAANPQREGEGPASYVSRIYLMRALMRATAA